MARFLFRSVFLGTLFCQFATASGTLRQISGEVSIKGGPALPLASVTFSPISGFNGATVTNAQGAYDARVDYDKTYWDPQGCSTTQYNYLTGTYQTYYYGCYVDNAVEVCASADNFYPSCASRDIDIGPDALKQNFELEIITNPFIPRGACKINGTSYVTAEVNGEVVCQLRSGRHAAISAPTPEPVDFLTAETYCSNMGAKLPTVIQLKNLPTQGAGWHMQLNFDVRNFYWASNGKAHWAVRLSDRMNGPVEQATTFIPAICVFN